MTGQGALTAAVEPRLCATGLRARTAPDAIAEVGGLAVAAGYVTREYVCAAVAREERFPTGLPTRPVGVAIPHADPDGVLAPCIAVGRTTDPIPFAEMGGASATPVQVRLVFLLALQSKDQTAALARLVTLFGDGESLPALLTAPTPTELAAALHHHLRVAN